MNVDKITLYIEKLIDYCRKFLDTDRHEEALNRILSAQDIYKFITGKFYDYHPPL